MARPPAKDLTERELEVMHIFWKDGELTANDARNKLACSGLDLSYVTVANLVRILVNKRCLRAVNDERPFRYRPTRSFEQVAGNLIGDLLARVFDGSREKMLVQLMAKGKKLTTSERAFLEEILQEDES